MANHSPRTDLVADLILHPMHSLQSWLRASRLLPVLGDWLIAVLCVCATGASLADDIPLPAQQWQGAVSFVTGGIGSDEANAFRAAAAQYNLRLTLSAVSGEFLAGVKVTLHDAQGNTVAEAVSDGPFLFFNVAPGKYQVTADNQGQTISRKVLVRKKGGSELYLRWKTPPGVSEQ